MKREYEEKTAFHTDHGTFSYRKMPFGLKNAWATYQHLMHKVFEDQIGRNVEVYVDDMVIKIHDEGALLHETFQTLTKAQMKLNLWKCTSEVEEGQFMSYQITNEEISPN